MCARDGYESAQLRAMSEPDPSAVRPAELRVQLKMVGKELRALKPGSPEQQEVLQRFEPILGALMALEQELSEG
jgi:hypothetical protein